MVQRKAPALHCCCNIEINIDIFSTALVQHENAFVSAFQTWDRKSRPRLNSFFSRVKKEEEEEKRTYRKKVR